jgi:hypothetical protein
MSLAYYEPDMRKRPMLLRRPVVETPPANLRYWETPQYQAETQQMMQDARARTEELMRPRPIEPLREAPESLDWGGAIAGLAGDIVGGMLKRDKNKPKMPKMPTDLMRPNLTRTVLPEHRNLYFRRGGRIDRKDVGKVIRYGETGEELAIDDAGQAQLIGTHGAESGIATRPTTIIPNDELQRIAPPLLSRSDNPLSRQDARMDSTVPASMADAAMFEAQPLGSLVRNPTDDAVMTEVRPEHRLVRNPAPTIPVENQPDDFQAQLERPREVHQDREGNPVQPFETPLRRLQAYRDARAAAAPEKISFWKRLGLGMLAGLGSGQGGGWGGLLGRMLGGGVISAVAPNLLSRINQKRELQGLDAEIEGLEGREKADLQRQSTLADIGVKKANEQYLLSRPDIEMAKVNKPVYKKQNGRIVAIDPTNPTVGTPIAGANGEALQPDYQRPVFIEYLDEDGITVRKAQYDAESKTYKDVEVNGKPVVAKRVEAVTPEGVKAGTAATIESRESEGAKNRASQERRAALKINHSGELSAAERRSVQRKIRLLQTQEDDLRRRGQGSRADQKKSERQGYEQELGGAASGSGQTWVGGVQGAAAGGGQRVLRSNLPKIAERMSQQQNRKVSESEAEEAYKKAGFIFF